MINNSKKFAQEFISHSPEFYDDMSLPNIDSKHRGIVGSAYKDIDLDGLVNFRSWKGQNDLGVPAQIDISNGIYNGIVKQVAKMLFFHRQNNKLKNAICDDIDVIKLVGGEKLLNENPVSKSPGVTDSYKILGYDVNLRWLRYLYISNRILKISSLPENMLWVDIGSFYGGLQGIVKKYKPKSKIVLVDFHHQLCRSYIYLKNIYPDSNHVFPDSVKRLTDLNDGDICYLPCRDFALHANEKVDLVTNFFSLGEMRREVFNSYVNSEMIQRAKVLYTINRAVSAPFFEPTYDSNLDVRDYLLNGRDYTYFDIFPIHQYLLLKRKLFGRSAFRNVSSSYIELLSTSKY